MKKILILIFAFIFSLYASSNHVMINEFADENLISVNKGAYKILEFSKMISKVKVNQSKIIEVTFVKNNKKPLRSIKIYALKRGNTTVFVDFADGSNTQVEFSVIRDLRRIIDLSKVISPQLSVEQIHGKIILKGDVDTNKDKNKILELFEKANVDIDKDLMDLIVVKRPDKMLRVKLYVTTINNTEGKDIKNQWSVGYKDWVEVNDSGTPIKAFSTLSNAVEGAVTLTGGLTAGADLLSGDFSVGAILSYLQDENIAKILDETTLITLENKEAKFHVGGTIYIKIQTTTDTGVPSTEIRPIDYGLQLIIKPKDIINDEFVDLEIVTKSTEIDWSNTVDGIPNFTNNSVETFALIKNKSTIVLGGLVKSDDQRDIEKVPFLGDIPILGALFRSEDFQEGKTELVFFITPEIVDVSSNEQKESLDVRAKEIKKDIKAYKK